jgi:hypothetical protein
MKEMVERGDPYFNENLSYESQSPRIIRMNEETRIARLERLIKG